MAVKKDEGIIGEVTHIDDQGSIVIMWVKPKRGKRPIIPIHFDHRMFGNMYEQEQGAIEGRTVRVTGDIENQTVEFID